LVGEVRQEGLDRRVREKEVDAKEPREES